MAKKTVAIEIFKRENNFFKFSGMFWQYIHLCQCKRNEKSVAFLLYSTQVTISCVALLRNTSYNTLKVW